MPSIGHHRSYSFSQKSIHFGRCVKRQFIRRFSSLTSQGYNQRKENVLSLLPQTYKTSLNFNKSALSEPNTIVRSGVMLTTFNRNQDLSSLITNIPRAPPLPSNFNENLSSETLKSTEFSKAIKNHTNSLTPSGTDLSQSTFLRPSQVNESFSSTIPLTKSKVYANPFTKPNLRNRRRTPLTPDVLALTKVRRPEHIKSSIAQRIEELKQASLTTNHISDEKPSILSTEKSNDLLITCEYKNNDTERNWLQQQTKSNSSIRFLNTNNHLQLNNRLFFIRSIEFIDDKNVRFYAQEYEENFLTKYFKQINIVTILIISILRLIENTLSNLSIPGIQIILNLIYVFILITIAIILLINQK